MSRWIWSEVMGECMEGTPQLVKAVIFWELRGQLLLLQLESESLKHSPTQGLESDLYKT